MDDVEAVALFAIISARKIAFLEYLQKTYSNAGLVDDHAYDAFARIEAKLPEVVASLGWEVFTTETERLRRKLNPTVRLENLNRERILAKMLPKLRKH
ncbi:MAG: hypothetical protein JRN38_02565 [Nitrososphaerota archaeon]|nr:hypothetical protein [Nitrososphaerota archaeon]